MGIPRSKVTTIHIYIYMPLIYIFFAVYVCVSSGRVDVKTYQNNCRWLYQLRLARIKCTNGEATTILRHPLPMHYICNAVSQSIQQRKTRKVDPNQGRKKTQKRISLCLHHASNMYLSVKALGSCAEPMVQTKGPSITEPTDPRTSTGNHSKE